MIVCGSVVSSEALAGAVSGLKAVPVTTMVSTSPADAPLGLAATCWATAGPDRRQSPEARMATEAVAQWSFLEVRTDMADPAQSIATRPSTGVDGTEFVRESIP